MKNISRLCGENRRYRLGQKDTRRETNSEHDQRKAMAVRIVLLKFAALYLYILVFAAIMYAVERTDCDEEEERKKSKALEEMWEIMHAKYNMTKNEFLNFTKIAHEAQQTGGKKPWSYGDSVHFALAVCTTIGYGDITPTTAKGKLLCIFGALVGIPLTLLTLNLVGSEMKEKLEKLVQWTETRFLKRSSFKNVRLKCFLCTLAIMVVTLMTGAFAVVKVTSWSYFDAMYFLFVSFSTIGFGDYIIHRDYRLLGYTLTEETIIRSINFAYMIFGLAVLASVINSALEVTEYVNCERKQKVNNVMERRSNQIDVIIPMDER